MNLQAEFSRQLDSLLQAGQRQKRVEVTWNTDVIKMALVELDSIGCAFTEIEYSGTHLESLSPPQLRRLGRRLAEKVNYLMEPIRAIEFDLEESTLQLRSERPQQHDSGRRYYEILARPASLHLCRYEKATGMKRQRVPAQLTREVLLRLVGDLESISKS